MIVGTETCDDGTDDNNGCKKGCKQGAGQGWECKEGGGKSECKSVCGDGF